jgi:hypothetical protein
MPRSSETVSALASALAKAQAELVNPEKSLVATLPADRGQPERSFRYASLASGLDIVRKTLGRHEIATIQTTAMDRDSGTIKLTTTLAHGSGEWIASDWPICPLADLSSPRRMGAALTYARRYALFTLVGIAGEDDLDAPDLPSQPETASPLPEPPLSPPIRGKYGKLQPKEIEILKPDASAKRRDELIGEISSIVSFDAAAQWAKRVIATKNTLTSGHAREIEAALEAKTKQLGNGVEETDAILPAQSGLSTQSGNGGSDPEGDREFLATQDRTQLAFGHPPRRRNKAHLRFVAAQSCLVCGRQPSDAHHLKFAQPSAMGRKVSDEFTVPLCRTHHRELHRSGSEVEWWKAVSHDIDPLTIATRLWERSRQRNNQLVPGHDGG